MDKMAGLTHLWKLVSNTAEKDVHPMAGDTNVITLFGIEMESVIVNSRVETVVLEIIIGDMKFGLAEAAMEVCTLIMNAKKITEVVPQNLFVS